MSSAERSEGWLSARRGLVIGSACIALTLLKQMYLDSEFPSGIGYYTPAMKVAENTFVKAVGKTYLVTGANVGLGKETARVLYSQGGKVIMACRTKSKAENAAKDIAKNTDNPLAGELSVVELDLSNLQSVRDCAQKIIDTYETMDALICNAGVMGVQEFKTTNQGFEMQWGVNHVGHYYLARLLTPLLKKTPNARLIMLSSMAHIMAPSVESWLNIMNKSEKKEECTGPPSDDYGPSQNYGFSKAANYLFAREYHSRYYKSDDLHCSKVGAVSLHPGVIFNDLSRHAPPFQRRIRAMLSPLIMKTMESGAACSIYCTLMDHRRLDGCFWADCSRAQHRLSSQLGSDDGKLQKKMWDITEALIKSRGFSFDL